MAGRFQNPPYSVLLGDVGSGKSTIVEKLTGERGRSSDSHSSVTKTSVPFWVPDGSLTICDTPGSNPEAEELSHNVWIASAINFHPVSKIFIVVKAETRYNNVVDRVRKYSDNFLNWDPDVLGVIVTHMDTVSWERQLCTEAIKNKLEIETVIFSSLNTDCGTLLRDILKVCTKQHDLSIDSDNFLKVFNIHDSKRIIIQLTNKEITAFKDMKKELIELKALLNKEDQMDLVCEFQAWMKDEIIEAQKRMADECNFTWGNEDADEEANQAGHIANMTNHLCSVLFDVRIEALKTSTAHEGEMRKCPHCGEVWYKQEGCDGATTCGNRDWQNEMLQYGLDVKRGYMATYTFIWKRKKNGKSFGVHEKLEVKKRDEVNVTKRRINKAVRGAGCGRQITWSQMSIVPMPVHVTEGSEKITTDDIKVLPPEAFGFKQKLDEELEVSLKQMKLENKPKGRPD